MESSESHEPSYYEVALTNRQVLIAFVVLLTSIVAAFLSGVWIGRGGSSPARQPPGISEAAAAPVEPPLEQLTFFNGKEPGARAAGASAALANRDAAPVATPAPSTAAAPADTATAEESATEAMRQNLDAAMAANRTVPAPGAAAATAAPTAGSAPAGTRLTTPAAKPANPAKPGAAPVRDAAAAKPTATRPAATGKIFVQVYSSNNAARAREIVAELRKAGFSVVVAETPKGGGTQHRVRVGPYAERAKADAAATKLRREFRLETWVTDSP